MNTDYLGPGIKGVELNDEFELNMRVQVLNTVYRIGPLNAGKEHIV